MQETQDASDLSAWETPVEVTEVTLQMMDDAVKALIAKKHEYEELDKVLKALGAEWDSLEEKLIGLLQASNKKSYKVDGVANVSVSLRSSYKVPSTVENKVKLFNYIEAKHGREALLQLQGINSGLTGSVVARAWVSAVMASAAVLCGWQALRNSSCSSAPRAAFSSSVICPAPSNQRKTT